MTCDNKVFLIYYFLLKGEQNLERIKQEENKTSKN